MGHSSKIGRAALVARFMSAAEPESAQPAQGMTRALLSLRDILGAFPAERVAGEADAGCSARRAECSAVLAEIAAGRAGLAEVPPWDLPESLREAIEAWTASS